MFSTIAAASIGHTLAPKSDPQKRQENQKYYCRSFKNHANITRNGVEVRGLEERGGQPTGNRQLTSKLPAAREYQR